MSKKPDEKELVWHEQQENILKKWSEIGSSYRFMHDRAYLHFEKQNFRFAVPVIVLSTITGTANFAQSSFPSDWANYVPLFIGFLNLTAGLITTIAQFLRVSELLEGHRSASISYSKFSRNISVELSLPPNERSSGGREFIAARRVELDRLIEQSPNIPIHIVKHFAKSFSESSFIKPDILEISDVEIFKDSENKKMIEKQKEHEMKQLEDKRIMQMKEFELNLIKKKQEHENTLIQRIRNDEAKLRKKFEEEMKKKLYKEKKNLKNKQKIKAIEKKKNMSISTISDSMSHLIKKLETTSSKVPQVLTPINTDTSSSENSDSSSPNTNHYDSVSPKTDYSHSPKSDDLNNIVVEGSDDGSDDGSEDGSDDGSDDEVSNEVINSDNNDLHDIVIDEENEIISVNNDNLDTIIDISENNV